MTETLHTKLYRVGGHLISIAHPSGESPEALLPPFAPFRAESADGGTGEAVFTLTLNRSDTVPGAFTATDRTVSFEWEDAQCTITPAGNGSHHVRITPWGESEPFTMDCTARFTRCTAHLPARRQTAHRAFALNNFLMMAYAFSTAPLHTLLMHASVVTNGGSACLFLGKSGTGKSTHTRLWLRQIPGTRLLNDDNPVIRLLPDGTVRAYGSPWSGKTPCYVSEDYPVAGIVRLEQAPENRITPLTGVRAFAALLPSCSCLRQDAAIYKGIVESVTELAQRCPVHHLQCLPNEEAARMSFNSLNPRNPMHS